MLVVGFGAIGVVMVLGGMSAGAAVPLVLLFATICWVATILVPWRRALRSARAERRAAQNRLS